MKTTIKWVGMGFISIVSIASLVNLQIIPAILFGLMAIWIAPPSIPFIEGVFGFSITRIMRYVVLLALWVLGAVSYNLTKPVLIAKAEANPVPEKEELAMTNEMTALEKLQNDYRYFNNDFKSNDFRGSTQQIIGETLAFGMWAKAVNDGLADTSKQVSALAKEFRGKLVAFQVKEFPVMRKAVTEELRKTLWEEDIDVSVQGKGSRIINFTSSSFATNKNIKAAQDVIYSQLYNLRFKEVRYRWYKGADEYTYFKLESPDDSDLIEVSMMLK